MENAILTTSSEVFTCKKDKFFSFEMSLDVKENLHKRILRVTTPLVISL